MAPSNFNPPTDGSFVTLTDATISKSEKSIMDGPVGLFGSGMLWNITPSELILTGNQVGQPIDDPSAEPTLRKIPNSLLMSFGSPALNVPVGSNPKLRASPPISNEPILTFALIEPN